MEEVEFDASGKDNLYHLLYNTQGECSVGSKKLFKCVERIVAILGNSAYQLAFEKGEVLFGGQKGGLRGKWTFGIKFFQKYRFWFSEKISAQGCLSDDGGVSIGPVWCQCPGPLPTPGQGLDGSVAGASGRSNFKIKMLFGGEPPFLHHRHPCVPLHVVVSAKSFGW
jgi:hypothetical protein